MHLSPGSFYLYCPKPGLGTLLGSLGRTVSFGRGSSEKSTQDRIDALIRRSSQEDEEGDLVKTSAALVSPTWNPNPSMWRLGGGAALVVHFGVCNVVGDLRRVQPSVYTHPEHQVACVFQGYLSNLDELIERYLDPGDGPWGSPRAVAASGRDPREVAAEVIYRMCSRGEEPLIVLSELQGQYSFALVDGERRQVFAARDPSGKEPLLFSVDDDGGVSLSNAPLAVRAPDGEGAVAWAPVPPGHYVAGRAPKLQQFALTPAQLSEREHLEAAEDDLSPHGSSMGRRSLSDEFGDLALEHSRFGGALEG